MRATEARTAAMKRGASRRKLRWKRAPRLQPSRSCAALVIQEGIEENTSPPAVSPMTRRSGPIMNGLGSRVRRHANAPARASAARSASCAGSKTTTTGR